MADSDVPATAPAPEAPVSTLPPKQSEDKTMLPPSSASADRTGGGLLSIWPPSQRTRDAVISRLIETLTTPSVLSKRYGTVSADEAAIAARRIEEEAFAASCENASPEEDGLEILQRYSKEISKKMLETVKNRDSVAPVTPSVDVPPPPQPEAEEVAPGSDEASA